MPTLQSLLYISDSLIDPTDATSEASQIVAVAQIRNRELGITGALICTDAHFAQVLEGSPVSIEQLMSSIYSDPRHANIVVINKSTIPNRLFPEWRMAYQGPSPFVSRHLARLQQTLHPSAQRRAADWITDLAVEFSTVRKSRQPI